MNKRKKGLQYQLKVKKFYEGMGCLVHNQTAIAFQIKTKDGKTTWVSKRNDIFGVFDGIAIFPDGSIDFYQVTYQYGKTKKIEQFKKINNYLKKIYEKTLNIRFMLYEYNDEIIGYEWHPEIENFVSMIILKKGKK